MLALESVIVARLRVVLPDGWTVMGFTSDKGKREGSLLASVLFVAGNVPDSKAGAANVQPAWRVTLVTRRGDDASTAIDEAFGLSVEALHNWTPGTVSGRTWARMSLVQVAPPQYPEDGLVGIELTFTTSARFDGQS